MQSGKNGAVVCSTPKVQYSYADGSSGTVRATGVTYPNGRSLSFDYGATGTVQENQYDDRNFRLVRKDYSGGVLTETRHFYYTSAWQVLDERLYAMQDGNWNVTAITDASGDVQERYAFAAYGEPLFWSAGFVEQSGSSFGWEVLFTGQRWDEVSRLNYYGSRFVSPELGLFLQREPNGPVDGPTLYGILRSNGISRSTWPGNRRSLEPAGSVVVWVEQPVRTHAIRSSFRCRTSIDKRPRWQRWLFPLLEKRC